MSAEWAKGPAFAPSAEALGVCTDQIVAVMHVNGTVSVLFTPTEDNEAVWHAILVADADGILREQHRALVPDFIENLRKGLY